MADYPITAVLMDLDGTLVRTEVIHAESWIKAGEEIGLKVTQEMLDYQRATTNDIAARMMLKDRESQLEPEKFKALVSELAQLKDHYVQERAGESHLFPGTLEGIAELKSKGLQVAITTSANEAWATKILSAHPNLARLVPIVVHMGMYVHSKPNPEPLFTTLQMLGGLSPENALYVGDSLGDYEASLNARMRFLYFCPEGTNPTNEDIPSELRIRDLREVIDRIPGV